MNSCKILCISVIMIAEDDNMITPTIKTERLILRKIKIEDVQIAFNNWCNSDVVDKYVLWKKHPDVETTIK